ncbi:MAG: histidinol-phosphate aminotransferase family protein [Dehalococcoidales bacterium]|nr:histidinol-phosphate aminotransferase family protein [Dehalococcoidales bacterium]
MSLRPKRAIAGLQNCVHGGINHAELKALGLDPNEILDFSVCTNPFMPPPGIKEKMSAINIEQYPDSRSTELRERLSERLKISAENILVGSGTTELIRLIALTYFRQRDAVLLLEPTYGEYEVAGRLAGARLIKYRARERNHFTPEIEEVVELIRKNQPKAVFICNPNNPTGKYLSRSDIEKVLDGMDDSLLVLDEAYIDFVEKTWNSFDLAQRGNAVVLRSMTKDYGLPGLRLGYAVARRVIIDSLRLAAPPWNVNAIAQKVAIAVLEKEEYLRQSLRQVREAKRFLVTELTGLGFKVLPSDANYFLVKMGNAAEFRRSLLKECILVRDCTSFALPEYIRIAPRTMPECERLITAIGSLIKAGEKA